MYTIRRSPLEKCIVLLCNYYCFDIKGGISIFECELFLWEWNKSCKFRNLMEGIHNFYLPSNFDAFYSLN